MRPKCAQAVATLTDDEWRRMLVYATDEHVYDTIVCALRRIGAVVPQLDVAAIDRFVPSGTYAEGHLVADSLLRSSSAINSQMTEMLRPDQENERRLCTALLNLRQEVRERKAPLLHLVDFYELLRFVPVDEDRVAEVVKALGIDAFARRLLHVMARLLRLSEGYQPFPPQEDKAAHRLMTDLTKFGEWI